MSARRSVQKADRQEGELKGLVWIRSWPGSEEGPAMRRESNRTSRCASLEVKRFCSRLTLLVCAKGLLPPSAPPYEPGLIRG